tara:strand:- start:2923 stop:6717 length:3795 start_codon:yes stop_codon:yes gene_type:complete
MGLIDRKDIEGWADSYSASGQLPYLMLLLARASTPKNTYIDIPFGSAVTVGGWDGVVNCTGCGFPVPEGLSLWEFSVGSDVKGKADENYGKRTDKSLGHDISQATFVFVTPRFWKEKNQWISDRLAEGKWKDVRVFDSSDLAQWLDANWAAARWFSVHARRYPLDGIMTANEFWEEWSIGPKGELPPKTITSGREREAEELQSFLNSEPGIKAIKASTKAEAIAFIVACAKQFERNGKETFFARTLLVSDENSFRGVRINSANPLNLIPRFEDTQPLFAAVTGGHHVLVPLGADDSFNQETITLPTILRDGQVDALMEMGLSREDASKYSRESGRDITILKKLIGFPGFSSEWMKTQDIRELVPAMLLGRWNQSKPGDRELLELISGKSFEEYIEVMNRWKAIEESPIIQIGETWRLLSPLDTWTNIAPFLTSDDFEALERAFMHAYKRGNPVIQKSDSLLAQLQYVTPELKFSGWSREGLAQSLILIGYFGNRLQIPELPTPQDWVDRLMDILLMEASGDLWISLDQQLPLLAEASPYSFLMAVENSLAVDPPPIMDMFLEEEGFMSKHSNHTGLLWALEGLAWSPDYLERSSLLLLRLAALDPGGNLTNRPINSVSEIFKPWHHQTLTSFKQRMEILSNIVHLEKEQGWILLLRMLPNNFGVGHPTHKMRWRLFSENLNLSRTRQEIWDTHSTVVDLLTSLYDESEIKMAQLLEHSVKLGQQDRKKLLDFAQSKIAKVKQEDYAAWDKLRHILYQHRSHPDAKWALPEAELIEYQKLYDALSPQDTLSKHIWLFQDHWPEFPNGFSREEDSAVDRFKKREEFIQKERETALQEILNELGIEKIIEISGDVKEKWALGITLSKIADDEDTTMAMVEQLKSPDATLWFIYGFFYHKAYINGFSWITELYNRILPQFKDKKQLAHLFVPLDQSKELWDFIDTTDEPLSEKYWMEMVPRMFNASADDKILGIQYLLKHGRFFTVLNSTSTFIEEIPTKLLVEVLEKTALEKASEKIRIQEYEITGVFDELDKREDMDPDKLINLEWLYLSLLARYGTGRDPKNLHKALANDPEFFVEVLKWAYQPVNTELLEKEKAEIDDKDFFAQRSLQAYQLLSSWKKIPGVDENGSIDKVRLNAWIDYVRQKAQEISRLEVADLQIGQVLASYPENVDFWPPEEICEIIERINTQSIKSNFSTATHNKRSFSTRGPFDGGDIERGHAAYFQKLYEKVKPKYPNVAEILSRLSKSYLVEARRMDERAERDKLEH